jgi:hypothetical protein
LLSAVRSGEAGPARPAAAGRPSRWSGRRGCWYLDVSIVELVGRPGHQGFFPIQGQPIQGAQAIARVRLIGAATNVSLLSSGVNCPAVVCPVTSILSSYEEVHQLITDEVRRQGQYRFPMLCCERSRATTEIQTTTSRITQSTSTTTWVCSA